MKDVIEAISIFGFSNKTDVCQGTDKVSGIQTLTHTRCQTEQGLMCILGMCNHIFREDIA